MSAKTFSRAAAGGARANLKQLRRMRAPIALQLPPPRNPVALAMATRSVGSGAGKHIRSQGAQRRADRMALQKAVRNAWND